MTAYAKATMGHTREHALPTQLYCSCCRCRMADSAPRRVPKSTLRVDVPDASRLSTLEDKVHPSDQSCSPTSTEYLRTLVFWAFYLRHAMTLSCTQAACQFNLLG